MATHSSILAWRIPWMEEPGRQNTVHGVVRVGHDLVTKPPPNMFLSLSHAFPFQFHCHKLFIRCHS